MTNKINKSGPSIGWFVFASLIYVAWVSYGGYFYFEKIIKLDIKEWGNLLAGVFSPLAFFWLLYAALAQKAELELQRQELQENNETQREQQLQMKRQADALDAQIKRLNGQADAQYQPVLVLATSIGIPSGVRLHVKNLGADVIEICFSTNCQIVGIAGQGAIEIPPPSGGALSYLPKGVVMFLDIATENGADYDREFFIEFKRLDNANYRYEYIYKNTEQKIVLRSKIEVE